MKDLGFWKVHETLKILTERLSPLFLKKQGPWGKGIQKGGGVQSTISQDVGGKADPD